MEAQRSDVVDRLLTKLLDKHAALGVTSAPPPADSIPARHAFGTIHNTDENSHRIRDPKLARLVEQLSCSETSRECHQRRAAALQARIFQMETEAIAATAARRRAEQEATTAITELSSLRKAASLHQTDHERERTTAELARVRADAERQRESHLATERRLRERTTSAERRCESIDVALRAAESRASELAAAHQGAMQTRLEAEREAARAREQLSESRREACSLQEELVAARDQLKACLAWEGRRSAAEEAVKEGAAQRATLAEECRGLRRENGRLESALMEERANRERVAQQAEHKLTAAAHEAASIRAKLESKSEAAGIADAQIAAVRTDAERMAEAHQVTVTALKERLAEARRALEETRKRAAEEVEATEAKNQANIVAAVEAAVSRHQRRIQDLELQLAHAGAPAVLGMPDGSHAGGVPGGFAASVLDYIPRSEHLRLMEARGTAREAECRTQIAAVRAEVTEDCRVRVEAISKELHAARTELEGAKQEASDMKKRADKTEHALNLLQIQYTEAEIQLDRARLEAADLKEKTEAERAQLTKSLAEAQKTATTHAKQAEEARYSLKQEAEAKVKAESVAAAAAKKCSELEAALALAEGRCDDLATALQRVHDQLDEAQHERTRLQKLNAGVAGRLQKVQHRCAEVEAQAAEAFKQATDARQDAERTKAAALKACEETTMRSQNTILFLLTQVETCLGITAGVGVTAAAAADGIHHHQMHANAVDARIGVVLSRCREVQAEATTQALAAQRAQQDAGALANALSACQSRCVAAEAACQAVQERYDGDLEALERAARDQVHGVRTRAEEAIAGVRRASTKLQERLSMQVARAGSLAEEVEGLRTRLAQQAEQADKVEGREKAVATLLEQLMSSVGGQSYGGKSQPTVGGAMGLIGGDAGKEKIV